MWRQWLASKRRFWPYYLVTLVVILPLLRPGFIFAPDMAFAPHLPMPDSVTSSYLFFSTLHLLNLAVPAMILQKIVLIVAVLLPGIAMHRLLETWKPTEVEKQAWVWPSYMAGLVYMVNPFVYSRFMEGQYAVLLGYALLPLLVRAVWCFLEQPDIRRIIRVAVWGSLLPIVSLHSVGPAVLVIVMCLVVIACQRPRPNAQWWRTISIMGGGALVAILLLSSYWLIPLLLGHGQTADVVRHFSSSDQAAFALQGEGFGRVGNALALQGFWADATGFYLLPQDVFGWWWLAWASMWAMLGAGVVVAWRYQRKVSAGMLLLVLLGLTISLSTALPVLRDISGWLGAHISLVVGYREPSKFLMITAFAYAYFAAWAMWALSAYLRHHLGKQRWCQIVARSLMLCLPLLTAPLMLWGFHGQFTPHDYPADWYATNRYLRTHLDSGKKVLFLPWHLYMEFGFAERVIAVPADKFFDAPVVFSNNPEYGNAASYTNDSLHQHLNKLFQLNSGDGDVSATTLQSFGIQYILVAKEFDYQKYVYLDDLPGVQRIADKPTVRLYKINNSAGEAL